MTGFWVLAAAMLLAALVAVMPALLGRGRAPAVAREALNLAVHRDRLAEIARQRADGELSPERAAEAERELELELLRDLQPSSARGRAPRAAPRWVAGLVAIAVPLTTVLLYVDLGSPGAVRHAVSRTSAPAQAAGPPGHLEPGRIEELVNGLARRLQDDPSNLQGWVILGRSYSALERHAEAREAFAAAAGLAPGDPDILVALAESTALAAGGDLAGRPEELLREALGLKPDHPDGLWLAGLAASQGGRPEETVAHWERLLGVVQDPQERQTVTQYLGEARKQVAGSGPVPESAVASPPTPPPIEVAGRAAALTVEVALAPELRAEVAAADTVFIFARAPESRLPIAIVRKTVAELPTRVTLDDSMAMDPTMKLSTLPRVVVAARVSKSGSAAAQQGDLEGTATALSTGQTDPVQVVIDRRL
jgi:cytochrome c-type biogenesis protein CcmH